MENNKNTNRITYYTTVTGVDRRATFDENGKVNLSRTETSFETGQINDLPPGVTTNNFYITATNEEFANMFKYGDRIRVTVEKV